MFFSSAYAQAATPVAPNPFVQFIPLVLMVLVFYFLLIRPQQQARKKHAAMVAAVKRGDEVVTAGGIVGKVIRAPEGLECTVEIADGVTVNVVKSTLVDVRGKGAMKPPANDAAAKPKTTKKA
jgi:preprotein translocase subunit YajC